MFASLCYYIQLYWWYYFPPKEGSLEHQANKRIKKIKKDSPIYKEFRYGRFERSLNFIDHYWWWFSIPIFLFWASLHIFPSLSQFLGEKLFNWQINWGAFEIVKNSDDNFSSIIATIQASVLGLVVPLVVLSHEIVFKNQHLIPEIRSFILYHETKFYLLIRSSLGLLLLIVFLELFKIKGIPIYYGSNIAELICLIINFGLLIYFINKTLSLFDRSILQKLIFKFAVKKLSFDQLKLYLKIYFLEKEFQSEDFFIHSEYLGQQKKNREDKKNIYKDLSKPQILTDINTKIIDQVEKNLQKKYPNQSKRFLTLNASLVDSLEFKEKLFGKILFLRINKKDLFDEKQEDLLKKTYKFSNPPKNKKLEFSEYLKIFANDAMQAIQKNDQNTFNYTLSGLI